MIAVIGSNSFTGSNFVDYCLSQGEEVLGISRSQEPHPVFLKYKSNKNLKNFTFKQISLSETSYLLAILENLKPSYIVNFAAQGMVAESWENPEHWFKTNLIWQVNLHKGLLNKTWLKKYVHVSTPEVLGSGTHEEHFRWNPSTPYAVSRAACEMSLRTFFKSYDFPVVFTRAVNVYGPGQQLYRLIPKLMMRAIDGRSFVFDGYGDTYRSFVYVDDVCRQTHYSLSLGAGQVKHITAGKPIKIYDVKTDVEEAARCYISSDFSEERLGKDHIYDLRSLDKIETTPFDIGLKETYKWVNENIEVLNKQNQTYIHKE